MTNQDNVKKYFIISAAVLLLLVVGAIIWAISLSPNEETNLSFKDDGDPSFGSTDSKAVIRVFSDFECPACRLAEEGTDFVKQIYGDKVGFVWNDFPLEMHKNSFIAALAARCAEEQGKFWEYHDLLFARQDEWAVSETPTVLFEQYAQDQSLDDGAFMACLTTKRYEWKINNDTLEGTANRVRATPTFFINNKRFEGALPKEVWQAQIKAILGS
ncbi:MAG: thioredoxin domain-containing protein [Patescibacteria group bacterium]